KRAERRKRKRRSADRTPASDSATAPSSAAAAGEQPRSESFPQRMARRSEERNAAARAKLEPLGRGERPTPVTIGAIVSVAFAGIFTASAVIAALGSIEVSGDEPSPVGIAVFAAALWLMSWGMWRVRYWAVLGFQALLLIVLVLSALGLVVVSTIPELLATLLLLAGSGALFYFMIRAMARIQMPRSPGAE
ncbi:MAG TPA: hypothetical protein VFY33_04840, partial [Solirubrobacterales bacterium]|nr:hypothetical protein [Solirubrobacterales bacterium]